MLIRRVNDCEGFIAGDYCLLRELLHPDKSDVEIRYSLAHAKVGPGCKTKAHRLQTAEVYYVLQGHGTMHIGAEAAPVTAGCAVYIPPGSVQYVENAGEGDLVFLCIVDPAWRQADEEILNTT
jgi:mannose-6-phosphate isomerase-like protein (cupin superfamily)